MARFGVLATAVAGALLAVTVSAAPAPVDTTPDMCNPTVCMGLAILHSDCFNGLNPDPLVPGGPGGAFAAPTELINCICRGDKTKESYLNCYGFCTVDTANDPYCSQPIKNSTDSDDDIDSSDAGLAARDNHKGRDDWGDFKQRPPPKCSGPNCDKWDPSLSGMIGFCGVPGQACGSKIVDGIHTVDTGNSGLVARDDDKGRDDYSDFKQHEPPKCHGPNCDKWNPELSGMIGFCGVPGQACGTKIVGNTDDVEVSEGAHPEVTAAPRLEQAEIAERAPWSTVRYTPWINFCGVIGQACGEKIAAPTAAPGSNFVDVGDV